ncbi:hypothetical protein QUA32_26075 [Microcoleus sp. Pol14D6]
MRRGFQPPADLWGSVGNFGSPNVRLLGKFGLGAIDLKFDKIRYLENL